MYFNSFSDSNLNELKYLLFLHKQERNILVVSGLQLASLYRLEVQVITAGGQGPAASKTFQTPAHSKPVLHYSKYLNLQDYICVPPQQILF